MISLGSSDVVQTTPAGAAIARVLALAYELPPIEQCALMRRAFNHVYGVRFADGRRAVARLGAVRPRGAPNTAYETALLLHLKQAGVSVAAPWKARDGSFQTVLPLPEGDCSLMLFDYLEGAIPADDLEAVEATGRGLALLHEAGRTYAGPPSRYLLELPHLLHKPLGWMLASPNMDEALREGYRALGERLARRIEAMAGLSRVACHGDCHGGNNVMQPGPDGRPRAAFFDFDDTGPGYLAYDLAVYLWAMWPRKVGATLDASLAELWRRYLAGYRGVRPIPEPDHEAIAAFVPVRQIWLLGEHAARAEVWGTETLPTAGLRRQLELMASWESLVTPG